MFGFRTGITEGRNEAGECRPASFRATRRHQLTTSHYERRVGAGRAAMSASWNAASIPCSGASALTWNSYRRPYEAGGGSIDQVTNVSLIRVSISFKHRRSRSFVSSVVSFPFFDVRRFIGGLKALSWVARFPFICFHW
jgi:hypothetical protein